MSSCCVIYEQAEDGNRSVDAADLPVFSVGAWRKEAEPEIREAIDVDLDELVRRTLPRAAR